MRPAESLQRADAAIVGRLVAVAPRGNSAADYSYRVKRVYRGGDEIERGQVLIVHSSRRAAACALPRRMGHSYGLFLARDDGRWASGICAVISPRRLWTVAHHRQGAYRDSGATAGGPISCNS
jgi:hypothetical protein